MAKRRRASTKGAPHPFRLRKTVTFGADASAIAYSQIDTPLHQIGGGIMLLGAYVNFNDLSETPPPSAAAACGLKIQIALGEVTDFVTCDDQQAVEGGASIAAVSSSGANAWTFPVQIPVLGGIPIISKRITLLAEAYNDADFNSKVICFTLIYVPHKVSDKALLEHLMAFTEIS